MNKPDPDKHFTGSSTRHMQILTQASEELAYEKFRAAVEEKKIELLTKKSLWDILFPYRIKLERKQNV